MENSIIRSICRACLSEIGEFKSIFVSDDNSGYTIHLSEMIMACTSVQITYGDGLPEQICLTCAEQTAKMYLFKLKCEESDKMLHERLERSSLQEMCSNIREEKYADYLEMNDYKGIDLNGTIKSEISIDEFHVSDLGDDKTQVTFGLNETENNGSDNENPILGGNELCKKEFKCEFCFKSFSTQSVLKRHIKSHSAIKEFECHKCNERFRYNYQLIRHKSVHVRQDAHNGKKPFLCSTCGKGFNRLTNLQQHMIRHTGFKAHMCSTCSKGFATKWELSAHLKIHLSIRPYVCPICSHGFASSSSLTVHKRTHSGEKPYECDMCKMKFNQSSDLKRHKRTHTGEKPYVCKFCAKGFCQSTDLRSHLRIHTGEKPYECDMCEKKCSQWGALQSHKRTHTGEKPYVCDVCGRAFRHSISMKKHKKNIHVESNGIEG